MRHGGGQALCALGYIYLLIYVRWDSGGFSDEIAGYGQKGRIEGRAERGLEILVYI